MGARLGNVLYAVGIILCIVLIGLTVMARNDAPEHNKTIVTFIFGIPAILAYAIGWACRYVLAGRSD